jgi:hypothetical protein
MSDGERGRPELVTTTRVASDGSGGGVEHLADNRRLIVRRALLATAVGGVIPIPVLDDYFAGRVRAGMLIKIAERRRVDLEPGSADLLGDAREGNAMRNVTLTAAMLLAIKLAWKKVFALMAIGRRAEDMTTSYQLGMVFDHYCAKLHVGAGIDRAQAAMLRTVIFNALAESEKQALVGAFREGGKVLGRSFMEAPNWLSERIRLSAERWAESGGKSTDPDDAETGDAAEEVRWLDRAAAAVESRLGRVEQGYMAGLMQAFERRWREAQAGKKVEREEPILPDPPGGHGHGL